MTSISSSSTWPLRIIILLHATVVGILGAGFIGPVRTSIQEEYGLSVGAFGSWLAGLALIGAGCGFALMPRLRPYSAHTVVLGSLIIATLAMVMMASATTLWLLAIGWLIFSACGVASSHMNTMIRDCFQQNPRMGINLMHGVNAVGKVLGPVLVGVILVYAPPWRWALGIIAMSQALIVLGLCTQRRAAQQMKQETPDTTHYARKPSQLSRSWFLRATLPFAIIAGSEAAFVSILNTYLGEFHGLDQITSTGLLTTHLLGLVVGRSIVTALPRRIPNRAIIISCCLPAIGCFALPLMDNHLFLALILFIAGLPFSATYATFYDSAAKHAQSDTHALAFGSGLFSVLGIYVCIGAASFCSELHPVYGMLLGPLLILVFTAWITFTPFLSTISQKQRSAVIS